MLPMQVGSQDRSPQAVELRVMTAADLADADELRRLVGWNQTPEDWRRLLGLAPKGCFIMLHQEKLTGTVTTTAYDTTLAWIGMMLVHPDHRRKGIATRLMQQAVKYLQQRQGKCIKLDGNPGGQPLYEKLGFVSEGILHRWQSQADGLIGPAGATGQTRAFTERDWAAVLELDRAALGAGRPELLRRLLQAAKRALVWPAEGAGQGWGLLRPGAHSAYLGPLACVAVKGAETLAGDLLVGSSGRNVTWDIPDHNHQAKRM